MSLWVVNLFANGAERRGGWEVRAGDEDDEEDEEALTRST